MTRSDPSSGTPSVPAISRHELNPVVSPSKQLMTWYARFFSLKSQKMPNPLTPVNFDEFVLSHRFAVVHFWAPWNDNDRLMNQLLSFQVPGKWRRQVAFASVNIDLPEHVELIRRHKVFDVPFLTFYRDGWLIQTSLGMHGPAIITKYLQALVNSR